MEVGTVITAPDRSVWRKWLEENFETAREAWLVLPVNAAGEQSVSYNDAVEEALCFGWIDSTNKYLDALHCARRFTPRNPKSTYSQPNIERLKWLDARGMIHPSVRPSVEDVLNAEFVFPPDILDAIRRDAAAWENYLAFSEPYRRIRVAYIDAARKRPEEFRKRLSSFIEKTRRGKRIMGYGGVEKYYE